jgi:hypothetical protein
MRLSTSLAAAGLAAALTLGLAGCFSPAPSPSAPTTQETAPPETSADPATGELITGSGYSFNAPDGWAIPADAPAAADVFVIAPTSDAAGFTDNVNVVLSPAAAGEVTPDQIEAIGGQELEGAGAADVQVRPRVTIAGAESAHFSAQFSRSGITYLIEQYYAADAGQTYVITFSFGEAVALEDREALAESVLATWTWD